MCKKRDIISVNTVKKYSFTFVTAWSYFGLLLLFFFYWYLLLTLKIEYIYFLSFSNFFVVFKGSINLFFYITFQGDHKVHLEHKERKKARQKYHKDSILSIYKSISI